MHILGDVTSEDVELQIAGGQADDERGEEGEDGIAPELNPEARRHAVLGRRNSHHGRRRRRRRERRSNPATGDGGGQIRGREEERGGAGGGPAW